jgi:5-methylcytosine-specific restriction endonuclease McrBC GTP-binding regulatory subunit McrB
MASYIVRANDISAVVHRMGQIAKDAGGSLEYDPSIFDELMSAPFRRIKWFYYCDDHYGNTIRLYDPEFYERFSHLFREPEARVIVRGNDLGRGRDETKRQLLGLFSKSAKPPGDMNTNNIENSDKYFRSINNSAVDQGAIMVAEKEERDTGDYQEYSILAKTTHLELRFFAELNEMLTKKGQLILEGSPGSGKTFVAEHFGRFLAYGEEGYSSWVDDPFNLEDSYRQRFEVVQFHESYGYEDFMEGFRPKTEDGIMVFERQSGIFKRFCDEARGKPGHYVMLIDEINRGKPSKIFGELLYLLEYREKEVRLSSGEIFKIPRNVLLIGTMNTADKSIALVDYALRRRFVFVPLRPVENRDAPVLRSWLEEKSIQNANEILDLFVKLNLKVELDFGVDCQIGHSYFMDNSLGNGSLFPEIALRRIWKYSVLPLIHEYNYNLSPEELENYSLVAMRKHGG